MDLGLDVKLHSCMGICMRKSTSVECFTNKGKEKLVRKLKRVSMVWSNLLVSGITNLILLKDHVMSAWLVSDQYENIRKFTSSNIILLIYNNDMLLLDSIDQNQEDEEDAQHVLWYE